ncbi:MAG: hypothetical protein Kow0080_27460 [Candidatus Promineifilaceae bacterium]
MLNQSKTSQADIHHHLDAVRQAVKNGRIAQARHLLYQILQDNPENFQAWLWLAYTAPNAKASKGYIDHAARLKPNHPAIAKARAWLAKKETAVPTTVTAPTSARYEKALTTTLAGLLVVLLASAAILGWTQFFPNKNAPQPALAAQNSLPATPTAVLSSTAVFPTTEPTTAATTIPTFTPTTHNPPPTWTVTPPPTNTPTSTPTPTPTLMPTVVGLNAIWNSVRPLDVGPTERWIDVDLSSQTLTAYEGDTAVFTTKISSGLPDFPTVTGQFRIWYRTTSQTMDGRRLGYDYYLENVPHVMYFFEDYAIHGAYWHNNFGQPMSHGCVNVSLPDAKWLYEFATLGTVVNVHE